MNGTIPKRSTTGIAALAWAHAIRFVVLVWSRLARASAFTWSRVARTVARGGSSIVRCVRCVARGGSFVVRGVARGGSFVVRGGSFVVRGVARGGSLVVRGVARGGSSVARGIAWIWLPVARVSVRVWSPVARVCGPTASRVARPCAPIARFIARLVASVGVFAWSLVTLVAGEPARAAWKRTCDTIAAIRAAPRELAAWWRAKVEAARRVKEGLADFDRTKLGRLLRLDWTVLPDDLRALGDKLAPALVVVLLVMSMGGTWHMASAAPKTVAQELQETQPPEPPRAQKKPAESLEGKVNLNTATAEQLMLLPKVGPAKAERILAWRKKNGSFKRIADLRRVKGFGFKTFKRLEPFLDIKGETTLH